MTLIIFRIYGYFNLLLKKFVVSVVNKTTLMELKGIKIAATTGDNCPVTAKYKPTILYKNEIPMLILIIEMVLLAALM